MKDYPLPFSANIKIISQKIKDLQGGMDRPIVIAIDGGSGSGKSTIAEILAQELNAAWLPMDDFFSAQIPDHYWDQFSVEERFEKCFDWERIRENALQPLRAGLPARWFAFDFVTGLREDGSYGMETKPKILEPARVILLDGNFSASPFLADLVDCAILIDVPIEVRHARINTREDPEFLKQWHALWDPVEAFYYSQIRPKESYDLVIYSE
jgi:para-aminobenzoate synthetase